MKLSIIIPVFNEEKTIAAVLEKVDQLEIPHGTKEVIIVDDGSKDNTAEKITSFLKKSKSSMKFYPQKENRGKGAAVREGIMHATGEFLIIQDADLEYNPQDILKLVAKAEDTNASVVYGTRLKRLPRLNKEERRFQFLAHYVGNKFLSLITSIMYGQWITDMETCYKLIPTNVAKSFTIHARGFEFEPEITAKLMKKGLKISEVPITTVPRGYEEGKKLNTVRDGLKALWALTKYRFVD